MSIAQSSPYYLPLNVFTASKGSNLYILFVVNVGHPNKTILTTHYANKFHYLML